MQPIQEFFFDPGAPLKKLRLTDLINCQQQRLGVDRVLISSFAVTIERLKGGSGKSEAPFLKICKRKQVAAKTQTDKSGQLARLVSTSLHSTRKVTLS